MKISLLSDTHGYLGEELLPHLEDADEIWHAGDFGTVDILHKLQAIKPVRGVYGNIDGHEIRSLLSEEIYFITAGVGVLMRHIGARPPRYTDSILKALHEMKPMIFVCGHSHMLKIEMDQNLNVLYINPGAAGKEGLHKVRTLVKFQLTEGTIHDMHVVEWQR